MPRFLAAWLADRPPFNLASNSEKRVRALLSLDASVGIDEKRGSNFARTHPSKKGCCRAYSLSDIRASILLLVPALSHSVYFTKW